MSDTLKPTEPPHAHWHYPTEDFLACFVRAFRDRRADYIQADGHTFARQPFLRESIQWGVSEGLLYEDPATSKCISDEQWTVLAFRLTERGREQVLGDMP